jgi:hypothetical protein
MANKYLKKCSTSLTAKKMQIKVTLRFYLTPVRIAITENTTHKCWQGCGVGERNLIYYWREYKSVQPLWKAAWRFLKS